MDLSKLTDEELLALREQTENAISKFKNADLALKTTLNSAYGSMGSEYFSFFDIRNAEAVTITGQFVINYLDRGINKLLRKLLDSSTDFVIGADTDSLYLNLEELVIQKYTGDKTDVKKIMKFLDAFSEKVIQPKINSLCNEMADYLNAYDQKLQMKREAIAEKGLWNGKKKRYILLIWNQEGVQYDEPQLKVVGMDLIRSSTPMLCRQSMGELLELIMREDKEATLEYIENFEKIFYEARVEDIACPSTANNLNKYTGENFERESDLVYEDLEDFMYGRSDTDSDHSGLFRKKTPAHVKGSIIYNNALKELNLEKIYKPIKESDKVKFLKLRLPNQFNSNVISFPDVLPVEFDIHSKVDKNFQFEKTFLDPIQSILNVLNWKARSDSDISFMFE